MKNNQRIGIIISILLCGILIAAGIFAGTELRVHAADRSRRQDAPAGTEEKIRIRRASEGSGDNGNENENGSDETTRYSASISRATSRYTLENRDGEKMDVLETFYETLTIPEAERELKKALSDISAEYETLTYDLAVGNAQMIYNAVLSGASYFPWYDTYRITVERADSDVVSFVVTNEMYMGGAHGGVIFTGYNFDAKTGREITLEDIVTDYRSLAEAIEEQFGEDEEFEDIVDYYGTYSDSTYAEYLMEYYLSDEYGISVPWTITDDGLHIWFSDYMLGAYAFGARDIVLPYEDHRDLITKGEYFAGKGLTDDLDERVTAGISTMEPNDLSDFCYEEEGFMLMDYSEMAGVYEAEDGSLLELDEFGDFTFTPAEEDGEGKWTSGFLRANPGGLDMYEYNYGTESVRPLEERNFGFIALMTQNELALITEDGTESYYYSHALSVEKGYAAAPEVFTEEEMQGIWEEPDSGSILAVYPWRGEFEASEEPTGDYYAGDIIYNGDPNAPEYSLMIPDSTAADGTYHFADIYFYHDRYGTPCMHITFHYAMYDYRTTYVKQDN